MRYMRGYMLERLDEVNWAGLKHSLGSAEDLPALIRKLASSDGDDRSAALEELERRVFEQFSRVFQATPFIVPFLIELLRTGDASSKLSLLNWFDYLGDGPTPWLREPTNLKTYGEREPGEGGIWMEDEVGLSDAEHRAIMEQEKVYISQTHVAVREGLSLYLDLLETDEDQAVREICAWLAVIFPERVEEIAPRLRAQIAREEDVYVRATLIWSLGRLADGRHEDIPLFAALAHSHTHPLIYFYAAAALTSIAKEETPPDIMALVITGIYWPDWERILHSVQQQVLLGSIVQHGCRVLSKMGRARGVSAMIAALERSTNLNSTWEVVEALLDLVFGGKKWGEVSMATAWPENGVLVYGRKYRALPAGEFAAILDLDDLQRNALDAIISQDIVWTKFNNIYICYGLPETREELRALLKGS